MIGEDDLSKKYLSQIRASTKAVEPPEDESITTLWIGNVGENILEQDLFDACYSYGAIKHINILQAKKCGFVEFVDRMAAEQAASVLSSAYVIKGSIINVNWAKSRASSDSSSSSAASNTHIMPAPPGMESMPATSYALPNMSYASVSIHSNEVPTASSSSSNPPAPPPPGGPPPPTHSDGSGDGPSTKKPRTAPPPPSGAPPVLHYPSMDPQRLGAVAK